MRSFDQRSHSYLGYVLSLEGNLDGEKGVFSVGIGKSAQDKHSFKVGDEVTGESSPVLDKRKESVEFYKTSRLEVLTTSQPSNNYPPWEDTPVDLDVYRERGLRRLSAKTYDTHCKSCKWGCRMPVEMIIDHWNPHIKRYRYETFCYGPKSCPLYKSGPRRTVPGRKGMTWEEPDWVDEEYTDHRDENE